MFGFLKKKIKESIDGIAKAVSKKPAEEYSKEEKIPEKPDEIIEVEEATNVEQPRAEATEIAVEEKQDMEEIGAGPETQEETEIGRTGAELAAQHQAAEELLSAKMTETQGAETPQHPEHTEETKTEPEKPKPGLFGRIAEKFTKKITEVTIREEDIETVVDDMKMSLMENDVALEVAENICGSMEKNLAGKSVKRSRVEETVKNSLRNSIAEILGQEKINMVEFVKNHDKPVLILFIGFNGAGKTTTLARIGNYLKNRGVSCLFAAGDSFRAASIEQIQFHGDRLGVKVIKHNYGADSAAVIFDSMKYATAHNIDVVLADTAGRTHVNANLMDELKKVCRVNRPAMKILVLDSLTGNDIVEQAKKFGEAVGVDALVFTKADVYEKGGAILSATHTVKKPILFLGVGQDYGDLEEFDANKIVDRLFS
ncbi:MAG: signal recognition particle-docking protein FtsY [Candidatus Aenigmarchaeota archaeon]|nr:signal recognition particle-docking protein FtsY [Candidatus Aenigmarchaeota archaeon]